MIDVGFPMRSVLLLETERNKDGKTDKKKSAWIAQLDMGDVGIIRAEPPVPRSRV